jgi:hypothetical protein
MDDLGVSEGASAMRSLVVAMLLAAAPEAGVKNVQPKQTGTGEGDGFQKTRWGMSPAEVQRLYPTARTSRVGWVLEVADATVAGERAQLEFTFGTAGALSQVTVNFRAEGLDREQTLQRCLKFQDLLAKKYGDPPSSTLRWKSEKPEKSEREPDPNTTSVAGGQFALGGEWETTSTIISLMCERGGNGIVTAIVYSDKRAARREDDAALEDL